jgi:hypothetical protein
MSKTIETPAVSLLAADVGYDPIEDRLRDNVRSTIEAVLKKSWRHFLVAFVTAVAVRARAIAMGIGTAS